MTDIYTFECDLDRDLPEDQRAGLSIHDDGKHLVFGLAKNDGDERHIYLTPDMAENLAALLIALLITGDDLDAAKRPGKAQLIAALGVLGVVAGLLVGLVYAVVALVAAIV